MFQALCERLGNRHAAQSEGAAFKARAAESQQARARAERRDQQEALEKVRPQLDSLYEKQIKPFLDSQASQGNTSPVITMQASHHVMDDPFRLRFDTYLEYWAFGQLLPDFLKGKGYSCTVDNRSRIDGSPHAARQWETISIPDGRALTLQV